jgi:hypothetical protein
MVSTIRSAKLSVLTLQQKPVYILYDRICTRYHILDHERKRTLSLTAYSKELWIMYIVHIAYSLLLPNSKCYVKPLKEISRLEKTTLSEDWFIFIL